jgi:hypothetical protein
MLTTAGVVFLTISEKPWTNAGGTPASAVESPCSKPTHAHRAMNSPPPTDHTTARRLRLIMDRILQKYERLLEHLTGPTASFPL